MRTPRYLVQYTIGDWAEADRIAGDSPSQVARPHEAALTAYALLAEVARGGPPCTSGCASSPPL